MEDAHKQILVKGERKIVEIGNSKGVYIIPEILEKMGLKTDDQITMSLEKGKHGMYIAIWKEGKE